MLLFLLIKIVRGDFMYWINLSNKLSLVVSFAMRFLAKVLTDFTLVMHLRHNFEVGGVQFILLILQNLASCFVAGWLYLKDSSDAYEDESDEVGGNRKINAEMLWAGLLGLLGLVSGIESSHYRFDGQKIPVDLFHPDDGPTIRHSEIS